MRDNIALLEGQYGDTSEFGFLCDYLEDGPNKYLTAVQHYHILRKIFFDRSFRLNPRKARVQELLGEGNPWLLENLVQTA